MDTTGYRKETISLPAPLSNPCTNLDTIWALQNVFIFSEGVCASCVFGGFCWSCKGSILWLQGDGRASPDLAAGSLKRGSAGEKWIRNCNLIYHGKDGTFTELVLKVRSELMPFWSPRLSRGPACSTPAHPTLPKGTKRSSPETVRSETPSITGLRDGSQESLEEFELWRRPWSFASVQKRLEKSVHVTAVLGMPLL